MRVYVTYCSGEKDDSLKDADVDVTPDVLYTSKHRIRPFMDMCKRTGVRWAIFSDLYGVWFSEEKHRWYEKSPYDVTEAEFQALLANFDDRLSGYDEIFFYRPSPVYFHGLYRRLITETKLRDRIKIISSIYEIEEAEGA
jgi:hypothetical protein